VKLYYWPNPVDGAPEGTVTDVLAPWTEPVGVGVLVIGVVVAVLVGVSVAVGVAVWAFTPVTSTIKRLIATILSTKIFFIYSPPFNSIKKSESLHLW
jgi:hypothetical protein